MKIGQYCQRQRCRHVELEQLWQAFASRGFVSDSWALLFITQCFKIWVLLGCPAPRVREGSTQKFSFPERVGKWQLSARQVSSRRVENILSYPAERKTNEPQTTSPETKFSEKVDSNSIYHWPDLGLPAQFIRHTPFYPFTHVQWTCTSGFDLIMLEIRPQHLHLLLCTHSDYVLLLNEAIELQWQWGNVMCRWHVSTAGKLGRVRPRPTSYSEADRLWLAHQRRCCCCCCT